MKKFVAYRDKWICSAIIFLLPMASYFVLGPLEIYFGNENEFVFSYKDFCYYMWGIAAVLWVLAVSIAALLPDKLNKALNVIVLDIGILSYLQNMFLNTKLSENDGTPMHWDELGAYPLLNMGVWLVFTVILACLSIFLRKAWRKAAMGAAAFLSAIQIVAVFSLMITAALDPKEPENMQLSGNEQFALGSKDNIVVLVLDAYGASSFEGVLTEYPEVAGIFSDFTFYNNTDCHYYCTFPSMTHMFTGADFDFEANTSQEWMEKAWNSERAGNFFAQLRKAGYTRNLFSAGTGYVYGDLKNMYGKFDNICENEWIVSHSRLLSMLGKMSAYKYVPYVVKPYFEVLTKEFYAATAPKEGSAVINDNWQFYQMLMKDGLSVERDMDRAFIVQHLMGLHEPYLLSEKAEPVEEASARQTGRGLMVIVEEYLRQMKELGLYDDSVIIIMADHGVWYGDDTQPVFLIKGKGEGHDRMQITASPVSLDDFQATILDLLGKDYSGFGTSIYDWKDGDERERTVYMRFTDEKYPDVEGSPWNIYQGYTYYTDRGELRQKIDAGEYELKSATPWR